MNSAVWEKNRAGDWGTIKQMVNAVCFIKPGEGSDRARFIIMPGSTSQRAKEHQCAVAPLVSLIEEKCKAELGHTNFKGCDSVGKANKVSELIHGLTPMDGTPPLDSGVSFGYDKSANDRTWMLRDRVTFQEYLHDMADVALATIGEPLIAERFEGNPRHGSKYRIQFAKFVLILDACLAYLFSGINPTSLSNRNEATITIMAGIRQGYGQQECEKLVKWLFNAIVLKPDNPIPVAQEGHWTGFDAGYTYKVGDPSIGTPLALLNDGDDNAVTLRLQGKEKNAEAISRLTKAIIKASGNSQVWVSAHVSGDWINKHGGKLSVVEVPSSVFTTFGDKVYAIPNK